MLFTAAAYPIFSRPIYAIWKKACGNIKVEPDNRHRAQLRLINSFLTSHHYQNAILNDAKSKEILTNYLAYLDFGKYLFTHHDIQRFRQYNNVLDDFIRKGDLSVPFQLYNEFIEKRSEQIAWSLKRLEKPFSDNARGELQLDREKVDWAKSDRELQERWEKRLLNEWIALRLAKRSDEKARSILKKRYSNMTKRINQPKADEIFQLFANAITSVYDPHTTYFSPRTGESFDISMSLSLEGIGAQLSMEEELITIKELITGGPAQKSGKLSANDHILGVAQGISGAMEDVVGWRLDEAVNLIRGKRGTIVRLQIQKASNDEITEITLVRDKIKLEDSAAQSKIKTITHNDKSYRIGIIELPSFYIDFDAYHRGDKNYRSTTRDVKKLLTELQKQGIDGLLIDLRENGGGSLAEAVDLTGLFIDKGPVVQVRRADGDLTIHKDNDGKTFYDGPLAVLINENSASASEIFA
ncbi:MAG: tail-specific protease, partial [Gammaproteobacteria bacterium]